MLMAEQWQQSGVFNPTDPTQKKIERYFGVPGAYGTIYYNRVPVTGTLKGPFTSAIGQGAGLLLGAFLASLGIGAALWGLRKTGIVKMRLAKRSEMKGLGWLKRRRR
jgi:hypothetical protein